MDTEALSTRMLYTCFVRCVGVCVLCVSLGTDRRSQVERNRVDTELLATRCFYTWGVCGKCVCGKCVCVCVCQCSSGQQFSFHSKSGRKVRVDSKSLTTHSLYTCFAWSGQWFSQHNRHPHDCTCVSAAKDKRKRATP